MKAWRTSSLLWRIFAVNALLSASAVALLVFTPAQVHEKTTPSEATMLVVGLVVVLVAELLLVRRVLREDLLERRERERRESGRMALAAQEEERLRVARELHDEVGQSLTAVALRAEHAIDHPQEREQTLREITKVTRETLGGVQRIARELRPEALDDLGLANALVALCSRIRRADSRPIVREIEPDLPQLSFEAELVIYRVAQEALTNAIRHGRGVDVALSLQSNGSGTVLEVRDGGPGLLPGVPSGQGLRGMQERAFLIGADLSVQSPPGGGVEVTLAVPVGA